MPNPTQDEVQQIAVRKPDWGEREPNNLTESNDKIRATWLGHACFLVEFPPRQKTTPEDRGIRILFDPVFSDRCSPTQYMGPKRYTRKGYVTLSDLCIEGNDFLAPPCEIEDLPEIDAVVISVSTSSPYAYSSLQY